MGKLDLKRFRHDLKETRASREPGKPGRPATTGAMAVVRDNLDLFDRMRSEDPALTWVDIAISLGKQGVLQRDGQPITAKRLAALISSIRKQRVSKEQAAARRATRGDVATAGQRATGKPPARERRLTLAPELSRSIVNPAQTDARGEDVIRAERYAEHDKLFKRKG